VARTPKCEICPISWFCKYYESTHTETALLKAEALKVKKAKELKKRNVLNKISKELKKRSVDNND
jgi:endonuclease-3